MWCCLAWSVCCLQDETGDVNRFSHSQLVSEQGCNACMMDLLRCLIFATKVAGFVLENMFVVVDLTCGAWSVCVAYRMRLET